MVQSMTQPAPAATKAPLTNKQVGELLSVSETAASRYRSGERHPKFPVQLTIAEVLGWSVSDQATAHSRGEWGAEFEKALCRRQGSRG